MAPAFLVALHTLAEDVQVRLIAICLFRFSRLFSTFLLFSNHFFFITEGKDSANDGCVVCSTVNSACKNGTSFHETAIYYPKVFQGNFDWSLGLTNGIKVLEFGAFMVIVYLCHAISYLVFLSLVSDRVGYGRDHEPWPYLHLLQRI